jgi:hypothetical protein
VSARRVAVVVVAGVGDNPRSDAAERVANGLTRWAGFDPPAEHSEWFEAPDRIQAVQRFATGKGDVAVDVYEFWWADLSRFPAALRSFLAAFLGLFLAFPSVGRTALRHAKSITERKQPAVRGLRGNVDYHLLGVLAWLVAVPVVVLTAMLLMTVGALAVAIALPDSNSITGVIALGLYGGTLAVGGLGLLRHYEKQSGRQPSFVLGIVAVAAATAICAWRLAEHGVHGRSIELAIADTAAVLVAYPLRLLWLAVLVTALLTTIVLGLKLVAAGLKRTEGRFDQRRKRTVSAVVTLGVGPIGVAMLMAIFSAALGAAAQKVGKGVTWTWPETPLCLAQPDSWRLGRCGGTLTAWDFGARLLSDTLYSLAGVTGVALAATIVVGAACLLSSRPRFGRRPPGAALADRQAARTSHVLAVVEHPATCALLLLAGLLANYAGAAAWLHFLPYFHPGREHASWSPTVAAILGGAVTTLVVVARLMGLSPSNLAADGKAPGLLRAVLDKPYDIATFLREPLGYRRLRLGSHFGGDDRAPRQRMLGRYRALMTHVGRRSYDRIVFVAHSQGTILTVTLLHETEVVLPDEVSLLTFGCPLRQLYLQRFPSQYGWVADLPDSDKRTAFVRRVTREWVNAAAAADPIGRTVFRRPPARWSDVDSWGVVGSGSPQLEELSVGAGGHSSYWTSDRLFRRLERMIVDQ